MMCPTMSVTTPTSCWPSPMRKSARASLPLTVTFHCGYYQRSHCIVRDSPRYNRPVHVYQYSSRPIFNSDEHVPKTQEDWCRKTDQAALSNGLARGVDWTEVHLNSRGKERHPIRLSIHLFGRSRYAAVLQAKVKASEPSGQDDPRVVRLLEVERSSAQTTVRRCHWMDSWWQIEDGALWCLIGHVWQLITCASAGETAARQEAGAARSQRLAAEARLYAEQTRLQAGLDPDAAEQEQVTHQQ